MMKKILFTKFCSERKKEFQIETQIVEENNNKHVIKRPLYKEGKEHIKRIFQNYKRLSSNFYKNDNVYVCPCEIKDDGVYFEYINGKNLDVIIGEYVIEKNYEELCNLIEKLMRVIYNVENSQTFEKTPEFIKIFGDLEFSNNLKSSDNSNIDMIAGNIIIGEKISIVDYEWVFQFPVPFKYIIFRTLFFNHDIACLPKEIQDRIYEIPEISEKDKQLFFEMEINFQKYVSDNNRILSHLYEEMNVNNYALQTINMNDLSYEFGVYTENEEEEKRLFVKQCTSFQDKQKIDLSQRKDVKKIIINPINRPCIFHITSIEAKRKGEKIPLEIVKSNEELLIYQDYYFLKAPSIEVRNDAYEMITIAYTIYTDINATLETTVKALKEINEMTNECIVLQNKILCLEQDVKNANQVIQNMENTKVWKLYKKLKRS